MPRRVIWSALGVAMAVFMVNFASLAGADSGPGDVPAAVEFRGGLFLRF